jgi:hypothetical protein
MARIEVEDVTDAVGAVSIALIHCLVTPGLWSRALHTIGKRTAANSKSPSRSLLLLF